jgi:hypothetical protein
MDSLTQNIGCRSLSCYRSYGMHLSPTPRSTRYPPPQCPCYRVSIIRGYKSQQHLSQHRKVPFKGRSVVHMGATTGERQAHAINASRGNVPVPAHLHLPQRFEGRRKRAWRQGCRLSASRAPGAAPVAAHVHHHIPAPLLPPRERLPQCPHHRLGIIRVCMNHRHPRCRGNISAELRRTALCG